MPYTELWLMLHNLKLYGMEEAFTEATEQPGFGQLIIESLLSDLVRAEIDDRQDRSINYQMGTVKFPVYHDLDSFDFASSEANEEQIRTLHEGSFIPANRNIIVVGVLAVEKLIWLLPIASQPIKTGTKPDFLTWLTLLTDSKPKRWPATQKNSPNA